MKQPATIIAGNWKMYKTAVEAAAYIKALAPAVSAAESRVFLAVPFTALSTAAAAAHGSSLVIGAQNMHDVEEGAFTGEISAGMVKEAGAHFVILGHSERRHYFHESNDFICRKVKRALATGLTPILCVGESDQQRSEGKAKQVLLQQLTECLEGIAPTASLVIAYEPVWAIGTGKTATPEIAQETHHICRSFFIGKWGAQVAKGISILYGGSVKPENISALMQQPDIDGALVGGASLSPKTFSEIVHHARGEK